MAGTCRPVRDPMALSARAKGLPVRRAIEPGIAAADRLNGRGRPVWVPDRRKAKQNPLVRCEIGDELPDGRLVRSVWPGVEAVPGCRDPVCEAQGQPIFGLSVQGTAAV